MPTLGLYSSVKGKDFIISSGADTGALWGCFLEVIVGLAGIGTAVTLLPVVKRQNEGMALGFVATRTLEAAMIFTGVASLLSLVTLHQDLGTSTGANTAALVITGASHVATYNWAFTVGQSLMPVANALLLGTLMYRSGLVPRVIPLFGLIGAPCSSPPSYSRYSGSSTGPPSRPGSSSSRTSSGSCRSASTWSSRASSPAPSQPQCFKKQPRPPTATSSPNRRRRGRAHQGPGRSG